MNYENSQVLNPQNSLELENNLDCIADLLNHISKRTEVINSIATGRIFQKIQNVDENQKLIPYTSKNRHLKILRQHLSPNMAGEKNCRDLLGVHEDRLIGENKKVRQDLLILTHDIETKTRGTSEDSILLLKINDFEKVTHCVEVEKQKIFSITLNGPITANYSLKELCDLNSTISILIPSIEHESLAGINFKEFCEKDALFQANELISQTDNFYKL